MTAFCQRTNTAPNVLSRKFVAKTHAVILSEAKDLCILSAPRNPFRPSRKQPPTLFAYFRDTTLDAEKLEIQRRAPKECA